MKNRYIIMLVLTFLVVTSCFKKSENNNNKYFKSDKFYINLVRNIQKMGNKNKYHYVFIFSDTLVLTSVKFLNGCIPCGESRKLGSFEANENKIILVQPINPKFNLIKDKNSLDKNPMLISTIEKVDKKPLGTVYKIIDSVNLREVYNGEISNFLNKKEYKFQIKD